jgi:hypothetical protein
MYKESHSHRTSITPVVATDGGQRKFTKLINNKQNTWLDLVVSETINITVGATRVINRGSAWASFDEVGVQENGNDRIVMKGNILRAFSEFMAAQNLASTRLGGVGVAATALIEQARLYFVNPLAATPIETSFKEKDPTQDLSFFAKLSPGSGTLGAGAERLVQGGTATLTVGPIVQVDQHFDDTTQQKPHFIPVVKQASIAVVGAQTDLELPVGNKDLFIRQIILEQNTDQGEVGDIINSFKLIADGDDLIGPAKVQWDAYLRSMQNEFGGAVYATGVSYGQSMFAFFNFQRGGLLANILPPAPRTTNLRFVLDCQPSVQAGVTTSRLNAWIFGLERVAGVTSEGIPFPV